MFARAGLSTASESAHASVGARNSPVPTHTAAVTLLSLVVTRPASNLLNFQALAQNETQSVSIRARILETIEQIGAEVSCASLFSLPFNLRGSELGVGGGVWIHNANAQSTILLENSQKTSWG